MQKNKIIITPKSCYKTCRRRSYCYLANSSKLSRDTQHNCSSVSFRKQPRPQKCQDGYMKPLVVNKDGRTVIRSQVVSARAMNTPHSRTTRGRTDDFSGATARNSAIPCVKGDRQECCLYLKRSA
ncbi:hypothetical protein TNCT_532021 [Trichonephila clavata]|uniref:Uncharacterized protein n=1 Tax=Trichonephila clavata TaxID=2740835 RepID=A0A8X6HSR5_TRICU|nr:hypothetical protein TNCT_532021 [Trichonephila clavata]